MKCELGVIGVQHITWGKGGVEPAKDYILSYGNYGLWKDFSTQNVIRYAFDLFAFVSDRISCEKQKGRRCDIIVLDLYAPVDNKSDGKEELERAFDQFCT